MTPRSHPLPKLDSSSSTSKMTKRRKSKHDRLPWPTPQQTRIDIARSNSTLKAFMPGRPRSWLASGVAVRTSAGPQRLASVANEPQAMDLSGSTVVPPPPSLPAPLRHHVAPRSTIPAAPNHEPRLPSAPASAQGTPSLLPSVDVSQVNGLRTMATSGAADLSGAQPGTASLTQLLSPNISPPTRRTVDSSSPGQHGSPTDDRTLPADPLNRAPAPAPSAPHRPRPGSVVTAAAAAAATGQAGPSSTPYTAANIWAPRLTAYFATCDPTLPEPSVIKHVRKAEMNYLYQACMLEDRFYITLHQLYCLYTVQPSAVRRLPGHSLEHEVGLAILPLMLGVRDALSPLQLDWLSRFPMDITALWNFVPGYHQTAPVVQAFLRALGQAFPALNNGCHLRGFPPLVHELVTGMGAKSGLMQVRLFVTIRNLMWGHATHETMRFINEIFERDQHAYYRSLAGMGTSSPVSIPQAHQNHATTISEYRQLKDRLNDSRRPDGRPELSPLASFDETPYRNLVPDIRRFNFLRFDAQPWRQMPLTDPQAQSTLDASILAYLQRAPLALMWSQGLQLFTRPVADGSGIDHDGTSTTRSGLPTHIPQHHQTTRPGSPPPLPHHRTSGVPPSLQKHSEHNRMTSPSTESHLDPTDPNRVQSRSRPRSPQGSRPLYLPPAPLNISFPFLSRSSIHPTASVPTVPSTQTSSPPTLRIREGPVPLSGSETTSSPPSSSSPSSSAYPAQARYPPTDGHVPAPLPGLESSASSTLPTRGPPTAHQANPALPSFRLSAPLGLPSQTRPLPDRIQATVALLGSDPPAPSTFPCHHRQESLSASQLTAALLGREEPVSAQSGRDHQPDGLPNPSGRPNPTVTALHQAHLNRRRVGRASVVTDDDSGGGGDGWEARLFPSVVAFALEPARTPDGYSMSKRTFVLDDDDWDRVKGVASRCQDTWQPTVTITEKAIDFRLRCCREPSNESGRDGPLTHWLGREQVWPRRIYVSINGRAIDIPRKRHHGRDVPLDITPLLCKGENVVNVMGSLTTTTVGDDRLPARFSLAVERVEYRTHHEIMAAVAERPPVKLDMIGLNSNSSRTANGGVIDLTQEHMDVRLTETVIGICDPHSSRMWEVPVKSTECKHDQCFDLKTFLATRPPQPATVTKNIIIISMSPSSSAGGQPDMLPASVDGWKCPFCGCDARPDMLRRSTFFEDVRRKLVQQDEEEEEEGKKQLGRVRSVLVRSDGTWQIREADHVQEPVVIERVHVRVPIPVPAHDRYHHHHHHLLRSDGFTLVDSEENTKSCDALVQRHGPDGLSSATDQQQDQDQDQEQEQEQEQGQGQGPGQDQGRKGKGKERIIIEID